MRSSVIVKLSASMSIAAAAGLRTRYDAQDVALAFRINVVARRNYRKLVRRILRARVIPH